jgi:hypothetical protein
MKDAYESEFFALLVALSPLTEASATNLLVVY